MLTLSPLVNKKGAMKKVMLGVVTRGADIHYRTYEFMSHTVCNTPGSQMVTVCSPYAADIGQEKLFQMFAEKDFDYLLVVDADVVPPLGACARMLAHDKQIVLAPVWFYDDTTNAVAYGAYHKWAADKEEERNNLQRVPKAEGFERVVAGGFGCMMVRKDVADIFKKADEAFVKWGKSLPEHMQERSSDNIFWAKCTQLGIEAYIDWSIETIHYRSVGLSNNLVNSLRNAKELS